MRALQSFSLSLASIHHFHVSYLSHFVQHVRWEQPRWHCSTVHKFTVEMFTPPYSIRDSDACANANNRESFSYSFFFFFCRRQRPTENFGDVIAQPLCLRLKCENDFRGIVKEKASRAHILFATGNCKHTHTHTQIGISHLSYFVMKPLQAKERGASTRCVCIHLIANGMISTDNPDFALPHVCFPTHFHRNFLISKKKKR